jgi:flagellar biosynthesis/type III secretory pathway chaperone
MENLNQRITSGYQKETSLFQDLLACLDLERDNLINLNLENLWTVMEKKQNLLESIEGVQGEIKGLLAQEGAKGAVSPDERHKLTSLSERVLHMKEEVRARVKENVLFIQETLGFFDELIQIFMANGESGRTYHPAAKKAGNVAPLFLYKEV